MKLDWRSPIAAGLRAPQRRGRAGSSARRCAGRLRSGAALHVPLDVFSVRKLGVPGHPELAMGAIASGGVQVLNEDVLAWYQPSAERWTPWREWSCGSSIGASAPTARAVRWCWLKAAPSSSWTTGSPRAPRCARRFRPCVNCAPAAWSWRRRSVRPTPARRFRRVADDVVCVLTPEPFLAVGAWYVDFSETSDDEVAAVGWACLPRPT